MRYSPSTNGFYADDIEYCELPSDVIVIKDDLYYKLLDGQSKGKIITPNGSKPPLLSDPVIDVAAMAEAEKIKLRTNADSEIEWRQDAVDAEIATDEEISTLAEWKKYRVLLMRVDTSSPEWPEIPM